MVNLSYAGTIVFPDGLRDAETFHPAPTVRAILDDDPVYERCWQTDIPRNSA